jgi:hypothetical protein
MPAQPQIANCRLPEERRGIIRRIGYVGCAVTLLCLFASRLVAQTSPAVNATVDPNVRTVSVDRSIPRTQAGSVRFSLRAPLAGDQIEQTVAQASQLKTIWRQRQEIVKTTTSSGKSDTRRVVTAANVWEGSTVAVQVRYFDATSERVSSDRPEQTDATIRLPVIGKTYRCERRGEQLLVVDEHGSIPPKEELEIVRDDMESVGRPSPLAEFLGGRNVALGETIHVPLETAGRLLGLSGKFGALTKFDLTLREVLVEGGNECGLFHANIEAASNDSSQLRLILSGPLVVQIETCRAVRMSLAGPIAMSESRGSLSASYQLISTGHLTLKLASNYRDAERK